MRQRPGQSTKRAGRAKAHHRPHHSVLLQLAPSRIAGLARLSREWRRRDGFHPIEDIGDNVAFWPELDIPYWAGLSAALVCQPRLGASLRKAWFLIVGTAVGAVAIVVLTACFPQERIGFLVGLALWGAACGLVATLLRNFAAYSAALAGYTPAIIAGGELGAAGAANGEVFVLAVGRASEICIGIICPGVVLVATDFGGARRRLAAQLVAISAYIARSFASTFSPAGPDQGVWTFIG